MTNLDNLKNKLLEPPKELFEEFLELNSGSKENLRQFGRSCVPRTLYPSQVTYSSTAISSKLFDTPKYSDQNIKSKNISFNLAQFTST